MSFVSITQAGPLVRLRRYDRSTKACTHDGQYEPDGITMANVEYYRQRGAPQDELRMTKPIRRRAVAR